MLLLGLGVGLIMITFVVAQYLVRFNYKVYRRFRILQSSIFYNAILRYELQSCLKLAFASCTTLTSLDWSNLTKQAIISIASSSTILLVIIMSPLIFRGVLMRKMNDLKRPSMVKRIGSLYLGIRDSDKWSLAYSQVFMVRRILFVGISFGLKQHASL